MARTFTRFAHNLSGAFPEDWTLRWNSGSHSASVTTLTISGQAVNVLRIANSSQGRFVLSFDTPGMALSGTVEIYSHFYVSHSSDTNIDRQPYHVLAGGGTTNDEDGFILIPDMYMDNLLLVSSINSSSTTLKTTGETLSVNTWYKMRVRYNPATRLFQARVWRETSTEPVGWQLEYTHSSTYDLPPGWAGIGALDGIGTTYIRAFGVGTDGDPAPTQDIITSSRSFPTNIRAFSTQSKTVPTSLTTENIAILRRTLVSWAEFEAPVRTLRTHTRTIPVTLSAHETARHISTSLTTRTIPMGAATLPTRLVVRRQTEKTVPSTLVSYVYGEPRTIPLSLSAEYADSIDDILSGNLGPIQYNFGMRTYNAEGIFQDDVSEYVSNIRIDFDASRTVKRTINFDLQSDCPNLFAYDLIEPYVSVGAFSQRLRALVEEEFSLGRFIIRESRRSISESETQRAITGEDRTAWLLDHVVSEPVVLPTGTNYGTAILSFALEAGFTEAEIILPYTEYSLPAPLTFEQGTTYYDIITTLADAINWSSPFMNNEDKLEIFERDLLSLKEPDVLLATDDQSIILSPVQDTQKEREIKNTVVIGVNDPLREPFAVTYFNDHPDNPFSRSVTGQTLTFLVDNIDYLHSVEVAEKRAKLIAEEQTANAEVEIHTWFDPRRKPFEIYQLYVECQESGMPVLTANWQCVSWSVSLEPGAAMRHQLKNILPV